MSVFFQAEDGIRDLVRSRGLGDVYKRQNPNTVGSGPFDETTTYQDVLGGRGGNLTSKTGVGLSLIHI